MKVLSKDELKVRLRRTVTNKFSTSVEPVLRQELRTRAFSDKDFCHAVDKAVDALEKLHEAVAVDREKIIAEHNARKEALKKKRQEAKLKLMGGEDE